VPKEFTYAEAGVDRKSRAKSKAALSALQRTYELSRYGKVVQLPYGNIFPLGDRYLDLAIEGVGTKVLLAQLADKYDTIGIDGVAMVVNDVIRSGATPLAIVDNIHAQVYDRPLVEEWMKGITQGAAEAGCLVAGGEIGDVAEIIKGTGEGKGFDMVFASVGELTQKQMIRGTNIQPGDVVVGLRSSGIHSNGISLARKILFKQWGGKYGPYDVPDRVDKELIFEALEPTRIYVRPLLAVAKDYRLKAAVHITGDAYLKFNRLMEFSKGVGFEFNNFKPQPIFDLIQRVAAEVQGDITDAEMLKTFNMGWGFAVVIDKTEEDDVIGRFERSGAEAQRIGKVTNSRRVVAVFREKQTRLD
jgi:phosphoribosylformylglycinamidine cyclo-ligase